MQKGTIITFYMRVTEFSCLLCVERRNNHFLCEYKEISGGRVITIHITVKP